MSLINQMLQDLEKRQPGAGTGAPSTAQVMAVPARSRRMHPAWWAVPLLLVTAGVLAWLVGLRPPASEVAVVAPPPAAAQTEAFQGGQAQPSPDTLPPGNPALQASAELAAAAVPAPPPAATPGREQPAEAAGLGAMALPGPDKREGQKKPAANADRPPLPASPAAAGDREASAAVAVTKQIKEITPPQRAENEYRKAVSVLQLGRVKEAIEGLTHALQFDPRHAAARQTLVGLLVEAKRYGEAERTLQEGLAIAPGQPELAMILARLQVERGDARGGLATLERTLPHASEHAAYQAFLAALLQRDGRHREAIEHYLHAIRNAPQAGVWLMGLGISLQAENRLPEAREAFSRARASNTLSPELQAFVEQRQKQLGPQ